MIADIVDSIVALMGVAASLIALATAVRYYRRTRRMRVRMAWLLMLLAVLAISISETADAAAALSGSVPAFVGDLFGVLAEIALTVGFVRLYAVELVEEHKQQEMLRQRAQQAEALSAATRQLSASLQLDDVLRRLVQEALELSSADIAAVYRLEPGAATTSVQVVSVLRDQQSQPHAQYHQLGSMTRLLVSTGQPQIIEDVASHPLFQGQSLPFASLGAFPMRQGTQVIGVLLIGFRQRHRFSPNEQRLLADFAEYAALATHNAKLYQTVEQLSVTDALTGLVNRRGFDERLSAELARARRYAKPLALVIFDLDHFKHVNDRYGHPAGDAGLRVVAQVLQQCSRETDLAARVGGEEFGLILPETQTKEALRTAERVRAVLASTPLVWEVFLSIEKSTT